jgi:type I restriction-modification system DNA methylase subunit
MTKAKTNRGHKQQMGQFMTPSNLSLSIIEKNNYTINSKVLEPSFGEGSFILNQIDLFIKNVYKDDSIETVKTILKENIYGCEYDEILYEKCIENIKIKYNLTEFDHNLKHGDFLITNFDNVTFDFIDGNPPFGGTINSLYNEKLDKKYESILEGDKIFIINLKQNPYGIETIGLPNAQIPNEIDEFVRKYIDIDEIFESLLANKLRNLYDDLGWELELNPHRSKFFKF